MPPLRRAYMELHLAVLLFGFTAILGNLIQLSALVLVWWRVLITVISLFLFVRPVQLLREIPIRHLFQMMGIGLLVALHWLTFYGAIKLSNASVALVAMATTSFFTSLVEPLVMRQRIKWLELGTGFLIVPGMVLVVRSTEGQMFEGLIVGLVSAFFVALFGTLNKKQVANYDPISITFVELGCSLVLLSLILPFSGMVSAEAVHYLPPSWRDWGYLLALALICTTLGYILALRSLRHLSAFASNLTISLEPVYGIILAYILLREDRELGEHFYWGCLIILAAVFSYPFIKRHFYN